MNKDLYEEVEGMADEIAVHLCDFYGSDNWADITEGERKNFQEMAESVLKPILHKISRYT